MSVLLILGVIFTGDTWTYNDWTVFDHLVSKNCWSAGSWNWMLGQPLNIVCLAVLFLFVCKFELFRSKACILYSFANYFQIHPMDFKSEDHFFLQFQAALYLHRKSGFLLNNEFYRNKQFRIFAFDRMMHLWEDMVDCRWIFHHFSFKQLLWHETRKYK